MKDEIEVRAAEIEMDMIDLGDAMVETRQPHMIQMVPDSPGTWTFFAK